MIICKIPPDELQGYIKENFFIDNGKLKRKDRRNSLGSLDKDGYKIIKIKGRQFKEHRIVWFLHYGEFPKNELDHINRNRLDNRIENLRESNRHEQCCNKTLKINPSTGVVGIYIDKTKGLKKKFAFSFKRKTYRFYSLAEAVATRNELRGAITV